MQLFALIGTIMRSAERHGLDLHLDDRQGALFESDTHSGAQQVVCRLHT